MDIKSQKYSKTPKSNKKNCLLELFKIKPLEMFEIIPTQILTHEKLHFRHLFKLILTFTHIPETFSQINCSIILLCWDRVVMVTQPNTTTAMTTTTTGEPVKTTPFFPEGSLSSCRSSGKTRKYSFCHFEGGRAGLLRFRCRGRLVKTFELSLHGVSEFKKYFASKFDLMI